MREEQVLAKEYIALSHPWDDTTTYEPFSTLRKYPTGRGHELGLFKQSIPYDELPATFKDAVYCTRRLGIRYLWIDSICIIQGRDGDFAEEATRMEHVFSGAYCVLAASRADNQQSGYLQPRPQREYVTFQRGTEKPFYIVMQDDRQLQQRRNRGSTQQTRLGTAGARISTTDNILYRKPDLLRMRQRRKM